MILASGCGETVFLPQKSRVTTNMEIYREQLEARLFRQHRNHPILGEKVEKVEVKVAKVVDGLNGVDKQVEFTQVVYDRWGARIPELEQQYYVVQFGLGRPRISSDRPQIMIGMSTEGAYSEHTPIQSGLMQRAEAVADAKARRFDPITGKEIVQERSVYEQTDLLGSSSGTALPGE